MFNMDGRGENTSWVGNIFQKFESLCCEVDDVVRQEMGHVENKLQTLSDNVVKFCLDLVEEDLCREEETNSDIETVDSGASKIDLDEEHDKKELCDVNHSLSSSSLESTEEVQFNSSVEHNVSSKIYEKLEVSVEESHVDAEQLQFEMSGVVTPKEEDLALNNVTGCDSSVKTEESRNLEKASTVYISSPIQSSNSVDVAKSREIEVMNTEITHADASTRALEGILKNGLTMKETETFPSLNEVNSDVKLNDQAATKHTYEEMLKEMKKRRLALLPLMKRLIKIKQEMARPELSGKSETDYDYDVVIEESEESETNQYSDWVIV